MWSISRKTNISLTAPVFLFGTLHLPGCKVPCTFYLNTDFSSTRKSKEAAQEVAPPGARAVKWGEVTPPNLCYRESRSEIQQRKEAPDFLKVSLLCHARTGGGRDLLCSHLPLKGPIPTVLPKALRLSSTHPLNGYFIGPLPVVPSSLRPS